MFEGAEPGTEVKHLYFARFRIHMKGITSDFSMYNPLTMVKYLKTFRCTNGEI
jgi:hypothetical protein